MDYVIVYYTNYELPEAIAGLENQVKDTMRLGGYDPIGGLTIVEGQEYVENGWRKIYTACQAMKKY